MIIGEKSENFIWQDCIDYREDVMDEETCIGYLEQTHSHVNELLQRIVLSERRLYV